MAWRTIATINKLESTPFKNDNSKTFKSFEEKKIYEEQLVSAYNNHILKSERLKDEARKILKKSTVAEK